MTKFDTSHAITAKWEGGWSDHKADPGGKTNWGITQATLTTYLGRAASAGDIRNLTKSEAKQIYKKLYWDRVTGDDLPPGLDLAVFDFGVNSGPSRAVKALQSILEVEPDGWIGDETLQAIKESNLILLINQYCDRRLAFLKGLKTWPVFGKGWSNRVADIRVRALELAQGQEVAPPEVVVQTPKGTPETPKEQTISQGQKLAIGAGTATAVLAPAASLWRENKDVLTDPMFLVVVGVLAVVVLVLSLQRAKKAEEL